MKLLKIMLISAAIPAVSFAQSGFTAWAGDFAGEGGSVCASVGQLFYTGKSGPGGSVIEGVQQPVEISTLTGTFDSEPLIIEINLYPNPADGVIFIHQEGEYQPGLKYQVHDASGRLLLSADIQHKEQVVPLAGLLPSVYYLIISDNYERAKTFKFIKTN